MKAMPFHGFCVVVISRQNNEYPDNISINFGTNRYSTEEHERFRDAIVQQLLAQLESVDAQPNGDGTHTEQ